MQFMLWKVFLPFLVILIGITPTINAESIPDWVKNTAGWWANDAISETEFVNAIEFLANEGIIQVTASNSSKTSQNTPDWVKNTAGWWANDAISETEFVNAIEFLANEGIINVNKQDHVKNYAQMWLKNEMNDEEFLQNIKTIKKNYFLPTTDDYPLPQWIINNAGAVSHRILGDSEFKTEYLKKELQSCHNATIECKTPYINSHGFRHSELELKKKEDVIRIFAIGGSTTYGVGVNHNIETWPGILQEITNKYFPGKFEIINAGIPGGNSEHEYSILINKISKFQPDMIIQYDGYNDWQEYSVEDTLQNWKNSCEFSQKNGFKHIIIVQPLVVSGNRVLTIQEMNNGLDVINYIQKSQKYVDRFNEINNFCTGVYDFRNIFDYDFEPIFYDEGHVLEQGNRIIAENIYPIIAFYSELEYDEQIKSKSEGKSSSEIIYAVNSDFSNRIFKQMDLRNVFFDRSNLSNVEFIDSNIAGASFKFSNLKNVDFSNMDLTNTNFSGANLSNVDIKKKEFLNAIINGADLTNAVLTNRDLSEMDFSHTILNTDLTNTNFSGANLSHSIISPSKISGINFENADLSFGDLSNSDLKSATLNKANFFKADLSYSDFSGQKLNDIDFSNANLKNANFSDVDLKNSLFIESDIENANFQNIITDKVKFNNVDFSHIKNSSLENANLDRTVMSFCNLNGVKLPTTITELNFYKSKLNNVDFSNKIVKGSIFSSTQLMYSVFENADFAAYKIQKSYLDDGVRDIQILKDKFYPLPNSIIASISEFQNEITIDFLLYNNFVDANLEGANLENSNLHYADFSNANLKNANLKNANLIDVFFKGANLEGANLEGANLEGANLEGANLEGANLECINHEICK